MNICAIFCCWLGLFLLILEEEVEGSTAEAVFGGSKQQTALNGCSKMGVTENIGDFICFIDL